MKDETDEILARHWSSIRSYEIRRCHTKIYNIRIVSNDLVGALERLNTMTIFHEQEFKFKVNASLGFVLLNNKNNRLRYFHPSPNADKLFAKPYLVEDRESYERFLTDLKAKQLFESSMRSRPDSSWSFHLIANLNFYLYPSVDHAIGCPFDTSLHMKNNKAVITMMKDSSGVPYDENKCFFRCLAMMKGGGVALQKTAYSYLARYLEWKQMTAEKFEGVRLTDLRNIEKLFSVSVMVYRLEEKQGDFVATLAHRSCSRHKDKLNLHWERNHFCFIKDIRMYCKSYRCDFCDKLLRSAYELRRHALGCTFHTKYSYPSGPFNVPVTIFDKLGKIGVTVNESMKYYPYFVAFDCESWSDTSNLPRNTPTIEWEARHRLASISVASNVVGYTEPVCWVCGGDEYELVSRMIDYLISLS